MKRWCPKCKKETTHKDHGFRQVQCVKCLTWTELPRPTYRLLDNEDMLQAHDEFWVTPEKGEPYWRPIHKQFIGMQVPQGSPPGRRLKT